MSNGQCNVISSISQDHLNREIAPCFQGDSAMLSCAVKRLDRFYICYDIYQSLGFFCKAIIFLNIETGEIHLEIPCSNNRYDSLALNWNTTESAVAYVYRGYGFSHVDITKPKINHVDFTLKHIARMAVLTSHSKEYLSKLNLPKIIVEYLGMDYSRKRKLLS